MITKNIIQNLDYYSKQLGISMLNLRPFNIMSAQGDSFSFLLMLRIYKYLELLFIFQICFTFNDNKTEIQTESEYNKVKTFNLTIST
jgi:RAB protein geranylgeranyltransferase component A